MGCVAGDEEEGEDVSNLFIGNATYIQSELTRYHAQAKRYLWERDRLDEATPEELASIADWLRYESFRRAIEPYERARNYIVSRWLSLHAIPPADMPAEIKNAVDGWNELIASKASEFGFEVLP